MLAPCQEICQELHEGAHALGSLICHVRVKCIAVHRPAADCALPPQQIERGHGAADVTWHVVP